MATTTRRKYLRRKYRKLAAAMAGVAVLSGAMVPGIPVTQVLAAPRGDHPTTEAVRTHDRQHQENRQHQEKREQGREQARGHERDRGHERGRGWGRGWGYDQAWMYDRGWEERGPVQVVVDNAYSLGFDAANDSFTLLSIAGGAAVVQVGHDGQTFNVDLTWDGDSWDIAGVRAAAT